MRPSTTSAWWPSANSARFLPSVGLEQLALLVIVCSGVQAVRTLLHGNNSMAQIAPTSSLYLHRFSCSCGCYVQNNCWKSHRRREKGQVPYVVCGTCVAGFLLASPSLRRLTFNPAGCWTSPAAPLVLAPPPNFLSAKNLLPKKYLGSKYFSSSRFLGNIPRVKFWREIFPENIPCKTLFAAPEKYFTQIFLENINRKKRP